ncbi:hypothetical protein E2C01_016898 [Portunus trituberculatus]|uniref:Uncharacterized protein n=1 Tax=Portunus trituberculatus TaxID=210409 RepID=A0A5B7DQA4_PORTR|nr:hypothetical protein [Portunus trituberculatus]
MKQDCIETSLILISDVTQIPSILSRNKVQQPVTVPRWSHWSGTEFPFGAEWFVITHMTSTYPTFACAVLK